MVNFPLARPIATGQAGHASLHTVDRDAINDLHERLVQAVADLTSIRNDLDNLPAPEPGAPGAPGAPGGSDEATAAWVQTGEETRSALEDFMRRGLSGGLAPLGDDVLIPQQYLANHLSDPFAWIYAPPPKYNGEDDWADLVALSLTAKTAGKGVMLRATTPGSGGYRIASGAYWTDGVPLWGQGSGRTRLGCTPGAWVGFGRIVGGQTESFDVGGFRLHGNNQAVTPLRIGRSVESRFDDVEVAGGAWGANPAEAAPAVTIDTTQNSIFIGCSFSANGGGGIKYSRGANNLMFIGCVVTKNHHYNHWFISIPEEVDDVPDQTPANIKFYGGLSEQPVTSPNSETGVPIPAINVWVNSGRLIQFIGSQCSRNSADAPTILLEQTLESRPIGSVTWNAGQMRAFGGGDEGQRGVIARVLSGTLIVTGGAQLIGATTAFEIGDNGKVIVGDHHQTVTVANLFAKAPGATKSLPELYELGGMIYRELQADYVLQTTPEVPGTTMRDLPNMGFYVGPGQKVPFEMDLKVQGADNDTDLALTWSSPVGTRVSWSALGLAETATTPASSGTRAWQGTGNTLKLGVIASTATTITVRGIARGGVNGGIVQPRVAQGTLGGAVTIYANADTNLRGRRSA